jgi:hypothetical protein
MPIGWKKTLFPTFYLPFGRFVRNPSPGQERCPGGEWAGMVQELAYVIVIQWIGCQPGRVWPNPASIRLPGSGLGVTVKVTFNLPSNSLTINFQLVHSHTPHHAKNGARHPARCAEIMRISQME